METVLEFVEPHETGGNTKIQITKEKAVTFMQSRYPELSEEEALNDFIALYWANWVIPWNK